jgi:hypothetical protein
VEGLDGWRIISSTGSTGSTGGIYAGRDGREESLVVWKCVEVDVDVDVDDGGEKQSWLPQTLP